MELPINRYGECAVAYFKQGYNCSQSVVAPFAAELGLDVDTALKLSSGFGGGIGRMRETCGAFCGLTIVVGLKYADPADPNDKSRIYTIVQQLAEQFKAETGRGSLICRDLLSDSAPTPGTQAETRTDGYYKRRPCVELVRSAADILGDYIRQNP